MTKKKRSTRKEGIIRIKRSAGVNEALRGHSKHRT